jgi:hypothetical protein
MYTKKFFYVSFQSRDGKKQKQLYMGNTPEEALQAAKNVNIRYKSFKVGKTAFNCLGEKI